jgi:hypothetical protein
MSVGGGEDLHGDAALQDHEQLVGVGVEFPVGLVAPVAVVDAERAATTPGVEVRQEPIRQPGALAYRGARPHRQRGSHQGGIEP